jgi:hypothetical protein
VSRTANMMHGRSSAGTAIASCGAVTLVAYPNRHAQPRAESPTRGGPHAQTSLLPDLGIELPEGNAEVGDVSLQLRRGRRSRGAAACSAARLPGVLVRLAATDRAARSGGFSGRRAQHTWPTTCHRSQASRACDRQGGRAYYDAHKDELYAQREAVREAARHAELEALAEEHKKRVAAQKKLHAAQVRRQKEFLRSIGVPDLSPEEVTERSRHRAHGVCGDRSCPRRRPRCAMKIRLREIPPAFQLVGHDGGE